MTLLPQDKAAIIVAGGRGIRMGSSTPKQILSLAGYPVLVYSLRSFHNVESIGRIVLVLEESLYQQADRHGLDTAHYPKLEAVVCGGKTRTESVWQGLQALEGTRIVCIHDGVRPLVSRTLIQKALAAGEQYTAAVPVLECTETIKRINRTGAVIETIDRADYRTIQTPQVFNFELLKDVYQRCIRQGIEGPDDASLVEQCGFPVATFEGDPRNIKITYPVDLQLAEVLLSQSK